jgi:hypothetical protein
MKGRGERESGGRGSRRTGERGKRQAGCDLEELNRWLNESPMSLIGYNNGERAMREKVSTMTG